MKKSTATQIASFALYVSSIALAIGIGMSQVGKESQGEHDRGSVDCPYVQKDTRNCFQNQALPEDCTRTHSYGYQRMPTGKGGHYWNKARKQCGFYTWTEIIGADGKPTGYYKEPEIFNVDPKCGVELDTPDSTGCDA